jgi:hypothetical protein
LIGTRFVTDYEVMVFAETLEVTPEWLLRRRRHERFGRSLQSRASFLPSFKQIIQRHLEGNLLV